MFHVSKRIFRNFESTGSEIGEGERAEEVKLSGSMSSPGRVAVAELGVESVGLGECGKSLCKRSITECGWP